MDVKCIIHPCVEKAIWVCECNELLCAQHWTLHQSKEPSHKAIEICSGFPKELKSNIQESILKKLKVIQNFKLNLIKLHRNMQELLYSTFTNKLNDLIAEEVKIFKVITDFTNKPYISKDLKQDIDELLLEIYDFIESDFNSNDYSSVLNSLITKITIKKSPNLHNPNLTVKGLLSSLNKESIFPEGHLARISALALTSDSKLLASGSGDQKIKVWSLSTQQIIREAESHTDWINALQISNKDTSLISCSGDKSIIVWNFATLVPIVVFKGHSDWVNCITSTKNFDFIISGSKDTTVRIWNFAQRKPEAILNGHSSWVNGVAVTDNYKYIISVAGDCTIKIWNFYTRKIEIQLLGHSGYVQMVAISPDQTFFASGSVDCTVRVWSLVSNPSQNCICLSHKSYVTSLSISNDSKFLAVAAADFTIIIWQLLTQRPIQVFFCEKAFCRSLKLSTDFSKVYAGMENSIIQSFSIGFDSIQKFKGHNSKIVSVLISLDHYYAVTISADFSAHIWNLKSKKHEIELLGHTSSILQVLITTDSKYLFTKDSLHTIRAFKFLSPVPEKILTDSESLSLYSNKYPEVLNLSNLSY